MEGGIFVSLGMHHYSGPFGIEVVVEHHFEVVGLRLDAGGFESIHDHLAFSATVLVIDSGEQRIYGSEEVGEEVFVFAITGEMGMGGHETIGIDQNTITRFVFEKEIVIEL